MTRSELLDRMTVLLAGRSAEELVFQEISTGAQDDLERATRMARSMVTSYGMSDKLGPMTYGQGKQPQFLEDAFPIPRHEVSEETVREIDQEVRTLITDAHERATGVLQAQRKTLDMLAHKLLEKETIEGAELRRIISAAKNGGATHEEPEPDHHPAAGSQG